ncbi:MAG TPA: hypothetical protein VG267_19030 [Terracidiphilus sp.]|jgi:hypothetical protein|nr:hypothetical protein [Terracidiphilus sp.]
MLSARWFSLVGRFAFVGAAALLAVGGANAQVAPSTSSTHASALSATDSSSTDYTFVSDSGSDALPAAPEPANGGGQYDNKNGGGGNAGWKGKLAFEGGAGWNTAVGDTSTYVNSGWDVTLGGGMHFSHGLALLAEYQFLSDGLPSTIIAEAGSDGGNIHLWSLTVDPVIDLFPKASNGVYVTGGGGFYRKVTSFTVQQQQQFCYYFYCGVGTTNATAGHFSSNQGGFNIGGGFRHRFSGMYGDGRMEVYAEARFVDAFTPAIIGQSPNGLGNTTIGAGTRLVPINFGIRY